jgi:hypothetical protein
LDEVTYSLPIAFRMGLTFGVSTNYVHHNQYLMDDERPETTSMIHSVQPTEMKFLQRKLDECNAKDYCHPFNHKSSTHWFM